jgi:hypothetical protein
MQGQWEIVGHWTYSGDPALSDKDHVRFLVGDVDSTDRLVSDEDIDAAVAVEGAVRSAAAKVAAAIAARFARRVTTSTDGNITKALSHLFEHYMALARNLMRDAATETGAGVYAGGISLSDKQSEEDDTDRAATDFKRAMFDYL